MNWLGTELGGKQLEVLKEAVPQVSRVAVLVNPANPGYGPGMQNLTVAAQALSVEVREYPLPKV